MKMNSLDALIDLLEHIQKHQSNNSDTAVSKTSELLLQGHLPPDRLQGKRVNGQLATDLGTEPIIYMREFNRTKQLPSDLVQRVLR
jgi:hypothetical protein